MNRLLSHNLWPTVANLAKNTVKRAAIAYVSSDEHLQFGEGDLLVCDASSNAIKTGQTSAAVLKRAFDRGSRLYNLPGLHAKILLLNEKALIGSANASGSSAHSLIEAGLLTDQPTIVATAQSFVNQLTSQAEELDERKLKKLLAIKVARRLPQTGSRKSRIRVKTGGHRTWIVGTTELRKTFPDEQKVVDVAIEEVQDKLSNPRSTVHQIRWTGNKRFRKTCKRDDWLIQMWRPHGDKMPERVYERMPIKDVVKFENATYFLYEQFPRSDSRAKDWNEFREIALKAGISRQITPGSEFEITDHQANLLDGHWKDK
jgi:hypothetical protein